MTSASECPHSSATVSFHSVRCPAPKVRDTLQLTSFHGCHRGSLVPPYTRLLSLQLTGSCGSSTGNIFLEAYRGENSWFQGPDNLKDKPVKRKLKERCVSSQGLNGFQLR